LLDFFVATTMPARITPATKQNATGMSSFRFRFDRFGGATMADRSALICTQVESIRCVTAASVLTD
jgi:hypothetical protein